MTMAAVMAFLILAAAGPGRAADPLDDLEQAFKASRAGDLDQAIAHYTETLKSRRLKAKQRAVTYLLRGEARMKKGDWASAAEDFSRALKVHKDYPQALYFRGVCYEKLDRLPEALLDVNRAAELAPDREAFKNRKVRIEAAMEEKGIKPLAAAPPAPKTKEEPEPPEEKAAP